MIIRRCDGTRKAVQPDEAAKNNTDANVRCESRVTAPNTASHTRQCLSCTWMGRVRPKVSHPARRAKPQSRLMEEPQGTPSARPNIRDESVWVLAQDLV